jgi:hypothetical protein
MEKVTLNEEFKRMQELAGILNENKTLPIHIKVYLLDMIEAFNAGNDNEYPVGKEMEMRYEASDYEDEDLMGEEVVAEFLRVKDYLNQNGPITISKSGVDWKYSVNGGDIVMNWIEPNWDELNGGDL